MARKSKRNVRATRKSIRECRDLIEEPRRLRRTKVSAAVLLSTSVATAPVVAQELEEIVVTATRREATVLEVPYNITAISSTQLSDNRIEGVNDLVQFVAGISYVTRVLLIEAGTTRSRYAASPGTT